LREELKTTMTIDVLNVKRYKRRCRKWRNWPKQLKSGAKG
jgi:hypothetical protein